MSLTKKLLIKPDMQIGVSGAPEGFAETLGELPAGVALVGALEPGPLDMVLLFVKSLAELEARVPEAIAQVKYDGPLWIIYPKKSSKIKTDIDRDTGWAHMKTLGYAGVGMVAVDATWSAMRYRPAERVGK